MLTARLDTSRWDEHDMQALTTRLANGIPPWALELATSGTALAVVALSLLFMALASCRVFAKAGYPAWFGLLVLVPVVNAIVLLGLAFLRWPIERELRSLRKVEHKVRRHAPRHLRRVA